MEKILVVGSINMDLSIKADRFPGPGETVKGFDFAEIPGGKGAKKSGGGALPPPDFFVCCACAFTGCKNPPVFLFFRVLSLAERETGAIFCGVAENIFIPQTEY